MLVFNMLKQKTEEYFGTCFINSGALHELFPKAKFIRELETPHGRPDVVLFNATRRTTSALADAILDSPSTSAFASVFFCLKNASEPLTIIAIAQYTGLNSAYVRIVIRALDKHDLLKNSKTRGLALKAKAKLPHTTIVSIEFKLHDWKKALKQSVRHLAFADEAYVIMPYEKRNLLLENIALFESFGISVGVYDLKTGGLEILSYTESQKKSEVSYIDVLSRILTSQKLVGQI